jgi:TonB-dependent starch-binding outer membrane protein SusC
MKRIITCIAFMAGVFAVQAQTVTVSGTVVESETGMPVPGANVTVKGASQGAVTDFDGKFSVSGVQTEATLVVSYIGYQTVTVKGVSSSPMTITLVADASQLDEVVVVGYGSRSVKEVSGAVSVVSSATIEKLKPTRIEQAIQGQVAGVQVTSSSGAPGAGLDIRIRGISTNGDSSPLVLVDGNVISELSVINPSDIESISVLKDASAGIYGVRAANGVIIITTKSGSKVAPLKVQYDAYGGVQETTRSLPLLNATDYAALTNEAYVSNGAMAYYSNVGSLGRGTDWQDAVFSQAFTSNQSIGLSGGSDNATYSGGLSAFTQDGIVGKDKSGFQRYNARFNYTVDLRLPDGTPTNMTFKMNMLYSKTNRKTLPEGGIGSVLFNAVNMAPTYTLRDGSGAFTRAENMPIEVINPLWQIDATQNKVVADRVSGVFGLNYKFWSDFSADVNYQWNYTEVRNRSFSGIQDFGVEGVADKVFDTDIAAYYVEDSFYRDYTFDALLKYETTLNENHSIKAMVGTSVFKSTADQFAFVGTDFAEGTNLENANLDNAGMVNNNFQTRSNRIFDTRLLSYFGRLDYNFKEKYLFTATVRRDGSTNFGPSNKFGYFSTFSGGWVLSDEDFFNNLVTADLFKLRGSYGVLGNDRIGAFRFTSLLNGEGVYVFDNQLQFGAAQGGIANPTLKWEQQISFNAGFDSKWFDNKLSLTVDYFKRRTEDLLLQVVTSGINGPNAPGSGPPFANAGSVENKGLEVALGYNASLSDNFDFGLNVNFTTIDNVVTEVNNSLGYEQSGVGFGIGNLAGPSRMEVGMPIGYFYGFKTDGIFQNQAEVDSHPSQVQLGTVAAPGDLRFVDVNQDGVLDEDDRTYIGDPLPDFTIGLNVTLNYKKFDFQSFFFASVGNDMVRNYERNTPLVNRTTYELDRWHGANTSNSVPRVTTAATSNSVFSDYYVEDASFVRAQNMQLGYTFESGTFGFQDLRIYGAVNNAFTLTKYRGYDPTVTNGSPLASGFDFGFYPNPRTYLLGLNLTF